MHKLRPIIIKISKLMFDFLKKWYHYDFLLAFYDFFWWFCFLGRPPYRYQLSRWALHKKTDYFDRYFARNYSHILEKYHLNKPNQEVGAIDGGHCIWVFWGQGEDEMPELVRCCYKQLQRYNQNVHLVSMSNLCEYVDFSPVIINKLNSGVIPWANFSDILRMSLLSRFGGLWLDATVWVSGRLPFDALKKSSLYTANSKIPVSNDGVFFWSSDCFNWSSWCLWTNQKHYTLFSFVSDMLVAIAEKEACWPDYVIQDYLIHYACRTFSSVQEDMGNMILQNPNRGRLYEILNEPFNQKDYDELIESEVFFKLSFKKNLRKKAEGGKTTYYGHIING